MVPHKRPSISVPYLDRLTGDCESRYEIRRRLSDRKLFLLLGFAVGWGSSLLLGPAVKGLIQGFLLGLI